jgi:hypothetical protein
MNNLEAIEATRQVASMALYQALKERLEQPPNRCFSEVNLYGDWLYEMRQNPQIFRDGWYTPPPSGIGIIFGDLNRQDRLNFPSLRPMEYWPSDDSFLDREDGIAIVYASPVDRETGMIGDFGMTIYFGDNPRMQNHLKKVLGITDQVFGEVRVGMKLSELFEVEYEMFRTNGLINEGWISPSDLTGINVGHTIPATDVPWSEEEIEILQHMGLRWPKKAKLISGRRRFINAVEETEIVPGMALTIEPRLKSTEDPKMPRAFYHSIVLIDENGSKRLLKGFDDIFRLTGMDYMLDNQESNPK